MKYTIIVFVVVNSSSAVQGFLAIDGKMRLNPGHITLPIRAHENSVVVDERPQFCDGSMHQGENAAGAG